MSRVWCYRPICPDLKKYGTLIYTITCDYCMANKNALYDELGWELEE
jgi:hypothetical protein